MALQLVLARRGQPCSVRIGVGRAELTKNEANPTKNEGAEISKAEMSAVSHDTGRFEAHAWVEWQGRVIMGGNIARWKPLTIFAPATLSAQTASPSEPS